MFFFLLFTSFALLNDYLQLDNVYGYLNNDEWPPTPHSRANGAHLDPGIIKKPFSLILFSLLTRCLSLANATWGGFIEFFFGTRDSRSDERA